MTAAQFTTQCKTRHSKSFTLFSGELCVFIYLLELVRSEKRIPIKEALMKTHILMYRSEKNRQIDIIGLKALPHNDRVHFEAQNYSPLLQNSPLLLTSNCDRHFLPLQNNQADRPPSPFVSTFLRCNRWQSLPSRIEATSFRSPSLRSQPKTDWETALPGDRRGAKWSIP